MKIIKNGSKKYIQRKVDRYYKRHLIKRFKCKYCGCIFRADYAKNEWILNRVTFRGCSVLKAKCPYCEQVVEKVIYHPIKAYSDGLVKVSDLICLK